jgi:3-oxoacyl-[acyl-carrier protein] reductase
MKNKLNKTAVIISGASGNIGKTIAQKFTTPDKYNLYLLCNTNKDELKDFDCSIFQGDITDQNYINEISKLLGNEKEFININCIGITNDKLVISQTEEEFMNVINVNLKGIFMLIKNILNKYHTKGHIINISSISGLQGRVGQTAYSASKGALISLTRSIAIEYGKRQVQANIIMPGFIPSKITEKLNQKKIDVILENNTLKHFQNKDEIACFVYTLSKMKNVSGQIFNLDSRINT